MSSLVLENKLDKYIVEIIINRPDKLNALTKPMWKEIGAKFRNLSKNKNLRCIIIRGKGGKSFSPGNDIGEFKTERSNSKQAKEYGKHLHGTLSAILNCPIPTVALIEGICVGGGLEIAACCDIRICGISSRFGVPINRLGLTMAPREMQPFIQLVGKSIALEILLEGRVFDSTEAFQKGLVNKVVKDNEVENESHATARRIADGAPLVSRWHKKFASEFSNNEKITDKMNDRAYICYDSKDFSIGYKSFLTKTKPKFKNK